MSFDYNAELDQEQIEIKQEIIRQVQRDYQKAARRSSSMSSIPASCDIDEFVDGVAALVDFDQAKNHKKVILKDEHVSGKIMEHPKYPKEDVSGVVLYSLVRRAPGTTAGGNEPFSRARREIEPTIKDVIVNDPKNPGRATILKSQWFDNLVRFQVVARSATQANKLALWFEDLMECNRYYFAGIGITRFFFDEREEDKFEQIGNEGYYMRSLIFYVRTEKMYELSEQAINNIVVCLTSLNKENQNGTR